MVSENYSNEEVLAELGYPKDSPEYQYALVRMAAYGENRWWLSKDAHTRAYWQTEEWASRDELLLQDTEKFRADLGALTGRVLPDDFIADDTSLQPLVRVAYAHYLKSQGRAAELEEICRTWRKSEIPLVLLTEAACAESGRHFFQGGEWAIADILDPAHKAEKLLKAQK